jgi:AcrR family transcriptional regulator
MNRAANIAGRRRYESSVRAAQAAETRQRILEAVVRTTSRGVTELSIPAVAREAGVSVRTVYRHFATKVELLDGLAGHVFDREELERMPMPAGPADLEPAIRTLFRRLDRVDPMVRAALLSEAGREARRASIPTRLSMIERGLRAASPDLDDDAVAHLTRCALILTSSASLQAWKDYLGLDADAAAAEVAWILRATLAGARTAA